MFEYLKSIFSSPPVLGYCDADQRLMSETHTSYFTMRTIHPQHEDKHTLYLIAYLGKTHLTTDYDFTIFHRQLFAITYVI
jgi:hypothetical protein